MRRFYDSHGEYFRGACEGDEVRWKQTRNKEENGSEAKCAKLVMEHVPRCAPHFSRWSSSYAFSLFFMLCETGGSR